jgi:NADH-quinone oxidoreductase subunit L
MWCPPKIEAPHHGHDDHGHDAHGGGHSQALYWVMAIPLVVLSVFTLFLGFGEHSLSHFILWGHVHEAAHHAWILPVALTMVGCGVGLAWFEYGRKGADQTGFLSKMPALEALFSNRWYMDNAYRYFLDYVIYGTFSRLFTLNDRRIVDGGIDGFCRGTVGVGRMLSFLQSGKLQYNLFTLVLVVAVLGLYFLLA